MPWREVSSMSQREEFVRLAMQPAANKAELCRRFNISRPTGDKWIARARRAEALEDRSRRPVVFLRQNPMAPPPCGAPQYRLPGRRRCRSRGVNSDFLLDPQIRGPFRGANPS